MSYAKIMEEFKVLNEKIEEMKKEMQEKSRPMIEDAAKLLFNKYPFLEEIFWTQYTPYFNDGEACEFSVHDLAFVLAGDENACDYEGSFLYTEESLEKAKADLAVAIEYQKNPEEWGKKYIYDNYTSKGRKPFIGYNPKPYPYDPIHAQETIDDIQTFLDNYGEYDMDKFKEDFNAFANSIHRIPEDVMESLFGNHVRVSITSEGIDVDEYAHD